jgi:hypothetical protein
MYEAKCRPAGMLGPFQGIEGKSAAGLAKTYALTIISLNRSVLGATAMTVVSA